MGETIVGFDGKSRCSWCGAAPEFLAYHDTEWGFPVSEGSKGDQDDPIFSITNAYRSGGYTLKEIGNHFGLHYSTVSGIIKNQKSKT